MAKGTGQALNAHGSSQQTGQKQALNIAMADLQKETGNFASQIVTEICGIYPLCLLHGFR